ncbi:MAG: DUF2243 domain-containing protein [Armatimonadota bacterium]
MLQLHNMMSAVRPKTTVTNVEINMFWDGLFHAFTWLTTALGLGTLWCAVRRPEVPLSTRALVGSLVLGWGVFNLVEGVLDHHILHLHHVVERLGVSIYDYVYLGVSVLLILLGGVLIRSAMRATDTASALQRSRDRGLAG